MPHYRRSNDPLRPKAQSDLDAELDQALRQLGDEFLKQEIPDRLLRVLRSAAEARHDAGREGKAEPAGPRPARKQVTTRGR